MKYKNNPKNWAKTGANKRNYIQPKESEIKYKRETLSSVPIALSGKAGKLPRKNRDVEGKGFHEQNWFFTDLHFHTPQLQTPSLWSGQIAQDRYPLLKILTLLIWYTFVMFMTLCYMLNIYYLYTPYQFCHCNNIVSAFDCRNIENTHV